MKNFSHALFSASFSLIALVAPGCDSEPVDLDNVEARDAYLPEFFDDGACDGLEVGDSFEPDSCNTCICTEDGMVCTIEACEDADIGSLSDYAPDCDGHQLGETWMESCNTCICGENGSECTVEGCGPDGAPH